jgi:hypothetical protein
MQFERRPSFLTLRGINLDKLYVGKSRPMLNEQTAVAALRRHIAQHGIPSLTELACEDQYLARFLMRRFRRYSAAINAATNEMCETDDDRRDAESQTDANGFSNVH